MGAAPRAHIAGPLDVREQAASRRRARLVPAGGRAAAADGAARRALPTQGPPRVGLAF